MEKTKTWKAKGILRALIQIYPRIVLLTILFLFSSSLIRFRVVKISYHRQAEHVDDSLVNWYNFSHICRTHCLAYLYTTYTEIKNLNCKSRGRQSVIVSASKPRNRVD